MISLDQPSWRETSRNAIINPDVTLPLRVLSVTQTTSWHPSILEEDEFSTEITGDDSDASHN